MVVRDFETLTLPQCSVDKTSLFQFKLCTLDNQMTVHDNEDVCRQQDGTESSRRVARHSAATHLLPWRRAPPL